MVQKVWSLVVGVCLLMPLPSTAAVLPCAGGDTACLIAAITTANGNGEPHNTITLEAGIYTVNTRLPGPPNSELGLPVITSRLTIQGAEPMSTVLKRQVPGVALRFLRVAETGHLTLKDFTVSHGLANLGDGGAVLNYGTLLVQNMLFRENRALGPDGAGGAIAHYGASLTITNSLFRTNTARLGGGAVRVGPLFEGPGIARIAFIHESTFLENLSGSAGGAFSIQRGTVHITRSTLARNRAVVEGGGAILNNGELTITNSTLTQNRAERQARLGQAITTRGTLEVLNSTIVRNGQETEESGLVGTGLEVTAGRTTLHNTLLAGHGLNSSGVGGDCRGPVVSLGHNLLEKPGACAITLQASDLTESPQLGVFVETEAPGQGHLPLLATSPARDSADPAACPPMDQLGQSRVETCDRGAFEFQP